MIESRKVVALVGGVGGAKLALGLAQVIPPENLTVVVNVADDFWHYGLKICPDSDTVMYTLAGMVDPVNGWGIAGDTTHALDQMRAYGDAAWFRLGDRDLATHLYRTERLCEGARLTEVTTVLAARAGLRMRLLPVTDQPVATIVHTREYGALAFQEYFVKHRWQPKVSHLVYEGIEAARPTPEVTEAIAQADVILIAPSNPWLSVEPMLAVPGLRDAVCNRAVPRIAITPIIGAQAVKGPAAKIMRELELEVSAATVLNFYGSTINGFVDDVANEPLPAGGHRVVAFNTLMHSDADKAALATKILHWIMNWD